MSSDLMSAMGAAATGLRAQTVRIRISAENLANADTTAIDARRRSVPPQGAGVPHAISIARSAPTR